MKSGILLFAVACGLMGCSPPSPSAPDLSQLKKPAQPTTVPYPESGGALLGGGWDSSAALPSLDRCVTGVTQRDEGQDSRLRFESILDRSSLFRRMDAAANIKANAVLGGGASGSARFAREVRFDASQRNIFVSAKIRTSKEFLTGGAQPASEGGEKNITLRFTDDARALLKSDRSAFRKVCGDGFVSAVRYGGSLDAIMTVESRTRQEAEETEATLNYDSGTVSVSANFKQMLKTLEENQRLTIQFAEYSNGGKPYPLSVDKLLARIEAFSTEFTDTAPPFELEISSYSRLPDYDSPDLISLDPAALLADKVLVFRSLADAYDQVITAPDDYLFIDGVTKEKVADNKVEARRIERAYLERLGDCLKSNVCDPQMEGVPLYDYDLRSRLPAPRYLVPALSKLAEFEGAVTHKREVLERQRMLRRVPMSGVSQSEVDSTRKWIEEFQASLDQAQTEVSSQARAARFNHWVLGAYRARANHSEESPQFPATDLDNIRKSLGVP